VRPSPTPHPHLWGGQPPNPGIGGAGVTENVPDISMLGSSETLPWPSLNPTCRAEVNNTKLV
jgi:hypothetical protein